MPGQGAEKAGSAARQRPPGPGGDGRGHPGGRDGAGCPRFSPALAETLAPRTARDGEGRGPAKLPADAACERQSCRHLGRGHRHGSQPFAQRATPVRPLRSPLLSPKALPPTRRDRGRRRLLPTPSRRRATLPAPRLDPPRFASARPRSRRRNTQCRPRSAACRRGRPCPRPCRWCREVAPSPGARSCRAGRAAGVAGASPCWGCAPLLRDGEVTALTPLLIDLPRPGASSSPTPKQLA